jgi:hypothetical protein
VYLQRLALSLKGDVVAGLSLLSFDYGGTRRWESKERCHHVQKACFVPAPVGRLVSKIRSGRVRNSVTGLLRLLTVPSDSSHKHER